MDTLEAPRLPTAHHPSTESLTLQLFARVGVVGGWRGGFFFQAIFGVESGQSMSIWIVDSGLSMQVLFGEVGGEVFSFKLYLVWRVDSPCPLGQWTVDFPCKFYLGAKGRIYFPFSQWEGPRCLAFIPFKFGVGKDFFPFGD
jgi:hypothetical protein